MLLIALPPWDGHCSQAHDQTQLPEVVRVVMQSITLGENNKTTVNQLLSLKFKKTLHCSLQLLKLIQQNVFIFLIWCSGADLWTFCFFPNGSNIPISPKYSKIWNEINWILLNPVHGYCNIVILSMFWPAKLYWQN